MLKNFKYLLLFLFLINSVSCATAKVEEFYDSLAPLIEERNISGAVDFASGFYDKGDKYNKLLYSLELGYLYHLNKNYKDSNDIFEKAKSLYALKDYTSTIFNNDSLLPKYYFGSDFEQAYINVFCALNYIKLRKKNEAVVEARQTNNLFNKIKISQKNAVYSDDPFIRYFMGMIYENAGSLNDAMVSYKIALRAYSDYNIAGLKVPQNLPDNLYTLYKYYSLNEEAEELKNKYPKTKEINFFDNGNFIVINYNGIAPKIIKQIIKIPFDTAWKKYYNINNDYRHKVVNEFGLSYISAAFAKYERYENKIKSFVVELSSENEPKKFYKTESFVAADIAAIMEKTLELNYRSVFHSRINRYVLAVKEIEEIRKLYEQKRGDIIKQDMLKETKAKLLENLYNETVAKISDIKASLQNLNSVDTKSWRSLPEKILMSAINLKPARYNGVIKFIDGHGRIVETKKFKVKIKKQRFRFYNL